MARQSLGALLGKVGDKQADGVPETSTAPKIELAADETIATFATHDSSAREPQQRPRSARPTAAPPELPPYLRLVRKETRLREDQQDALTQHARRLTRAKAKGAPRVTDNTLIRVAVDLLLARIEHAAGDDEQAILKSLNR